MKNATESRFSVYPEQNIKIIMSRFIDEKISLQKLHHLEIQLRPNEKQDILGWG